MFGNGWDSPRYEAVLTACCLRPDLAILPNGDLTEIGERGINLSGGQKQRVQLARAAYQQSDIVLLDDPLSAVDHHVAEALFTQCINGLMKDRARVLVTHNLSFVDQADSIALVKPTSVRDSYTMASGTAARLRETDADFRSLLATYANGEESVAEEQPKTAAKAAAKAKGAAVVAHKPVEEARQAVGGLLEEEEQETGVVDWKVYRAYIVAGCSWLLYLLIPLAFLGSQGQHALSRLQAYISQRSLNPPHLTRTLLLLLENVPALQTSSDFWLAKWSNDYGVSVGRNLGIYGALIAATTLVTICRSFSVATFGLRASRVLHHNLAHSVLRKSLSWYDRTPGGRLTNRFSKDIYQVRRTPLQTTAFLAAHAE